MENMENLVDMFINLFVDTAIAYKENPTAENKQHILDGAEALYLTSKSAELFNACGITLTLSKN